MVVLEQVVRSTKRIFMGAMVRPLCIPSSSLLSRGSLITCRFHCTQAFQLGDAKQATCYHQSMGSPLKSLIFEMESDKYACYSKWVLTAMRDIVHEFPRLRLHNRVAILGLSARPVPVPAPKNYARHARHPKNLCLPSYG